MGRRAAFWLWVVVAVQVGWVVGTAATKEFAHARGQHIVLATKPVDPRDMLRGDYLALRYDISDVARELVRGPVPADPAGRTLYVALAPKGPVYGTAFASFSPLAPQEGTVIVRGMVSQRVLWVDNRAQSASGNGPLPVVYGLERYYVPQGKGNPRGTLTVEVSVAGDGEPLIHEVFVDGKRFRDAMHGW